MADAREIHWSKKGGRDYAPKASIKEYTQPSRKVMSPPNECLEHERLLSDTEAVTLSAVNTHTEGTSMKRKTTQRRLIKRRSFKEQVAAINAEAGIPTIDLDTMEQVPVPDNSLAGWGWRSKWYIAISKHGYGISTKPEDAILKAQESVSMDDKPSQLLIYRHHKEIVPTGFVTWPNGERPKLVGLTTTHTGWKAIRL